jgi:exodeoxyribonuclease VII large subunit
MAYPERQGVFPESMNDSFDNSAPGGNTPVFTVSEIAAAVKHTVEETFGRVKVRGEISGYKLAPSGHAYLRLKDMDAVLDAVMWRGTVGRQPLKPEDGMEIIATGRLTTYAGKSSYQLVIDSIELAGQGALLKLIEDRKNKLAAEGLFDAEKKRELPFLPDVIGVVTSPTGAVIRDILHRLADRFPRHVLIWPVPVQGDGAAEKIAAAIQGFNALSVMSTVPRPDIIIVARGGGSLEDLMAFNEEIVVRAAAGSAIPLISAVGHETDTTLIDFASDRRAPTPTAAAEMAVPVRRDLIETVSDLGHRVVACGGRYLAQREEALRNATRLLGTPERILEGPMQALDRVSERLRSALTVYVRQEEAKLAKWAGGIRKATVDALIRHSEQNLGMMNLTFEREFKRKLSDFGRDLVGLTQRFESVSYVNVLKRGYAVVRDAAGSTVQTAAAAVPGAISIEFADGAVGASIGGSASPAAPSAKPKSKSPGGTGSQGSLL